MFYTLHRLVKGLCWALLLACLYWVWLQREALEPAYVWYNVYRNGGIDQTEPLPTLQGKGSYVLDGHTFQMRSGKNVYSVRLTGLGIPTPPLTPRELLLEKARREFLRHAVLSNRVHVEITYSNRFSLLGVAYVGKTNLNIHFVTNGLSQFKPEYVKGVPRDLQYRFFAAERLFEKRKRRAREHHDAAPPDSAELTQSFAVGQQVASPL